MRFVSVGTPEDVPLGERLRVDVDGRDIVIFNIDGGVPRSQLSLPSYGRCARRRIRLRRGDSLPQHQWLFNIKTGKTRRDRRMKARTYPVKVEGDSLLVGIS